MSLKSIKENCILFDHKTEGDNIKFNSFLH